MRLFSRIVASFSFAVTIVSRSPMVACRILEVAPHARAQALGLADVDDGALLVLEEVDARLRRQGVELLDDEVGEHEGQDSRVARGTQ